MWGVLTKFDGWIEPFVKYYHEESDARFNFSRIDPEKTWHRENERCNGLLAKEGIALNVYLRSSIGGMHDVEVKSYKPCEE